MGSLLCTLRMMLLQGDKREKGRHWQIGHILLGIGAVCGNSDVMLFRLRIFRTCTKRKQLRLDDDDDADIPPFVTIYRDR
mmetsp:Transcript_33678/g.49319  ORF Transcript_33678/g.49319 Transcript_33678/m.49319 type:complete len:80 (-) Transcript_33678:50-289(-)